MGFRKDNLRIGKIQSVDGSKIEVKADKLLVEADGQKHYAEVGSFVNCGGYHGDTICTITRVHIDEIERKEEIKEIQIIELAIVGSIDTNQQFNRGIEQLPAINCDVFMLTGEQINKLLGVRKEESEKENGEKNDSLKYFKVGKRSIKGAGDVYLNLDKLLGRHVAILGTTGSGKSCTVASITQSILRDYPKPRLIFFDIHNEYPHAFSEQWKNKTNCISWNEFSLPYWFFDLEEFTAIYHPDAGSNQRAEIKKMLTELKKENIEDERIKKRVSADSPIFFDIDRLIDTIKNKEERAAAKDKESWSKMRLKFESINDDTRYRFLKFHKEKGLSLEEYFKNLFGLTERDKFLTILDLSGLPAEVRTVCVGILTRLCFDYCYWDMDPENLPLALIMEEAHSYIPEESTSIIHQNIPCVEKGSKG